jgi:hypothetical protein
MTSLGPPPAVQDDYGFFGPDYSFADNIKLPGQIGVRNESSISAIIDAVGGVNHYLDVIAFGGPTFFDQHPPSPLGIRYFMNTQQRCSNGATASDYFDGVTKGDILGDHVAAALASTGLPGLKGLAPGMLENARDALDPRPIISAVEGSGYPVCQQVQCPVGDVDGNIQNSFDATKPYIIDPVQYVGGIPTQTRWVQALDSTGWPITVSKDEFAAAPKCYNANGTYIQPAAAGCPATEPAATPVGGTDRFALCSVLRQAQLPPTVAAAAQTNSGSSSAEGFSGDMTDDQVSLMAAVAVGALGAVALWAMSRSK